MTGIERARQLIATEREQKTGVLDLGNLGLTELLPEVLELTHLRTLNLGVGYVDENDGFQFAQGYYNRAPNALTGLPDLNALANLRVLSLVGTSITDLSSLQSLTSLRSLDCRNSRASDLTPLHTLTALQSLDCSGTPLSSLTPLQPLTALRRLSCRWTQVSDLAPLRALTGLKFLSCLGTWVSDLAPLQALAALQELDCAGTRVSDLTPLQALTALQNLACSNTLVGDFTPLQGLTALRFLDCAYGPARDLTPLQGLTALEFLNCSETLVSDLTPLQGLTALQYLYCSDTLVSDLTPLQALTALKYLKCSNTRVSDLTPLAALPSLTTLIANGCHLSDVPRRLLRSDTLTEVRLCEATIPGIPAELLSSEQSSNCLDNLRSHVADLEKGAEEVTEAKLMVLGNGRIGKTQICRRLRGLAYDDTVPSTHGITVTAERWAGSVGEQALNIWDFGGQDIYHGAHTLFMETSAVFLIVWHPDFEAVGEQMTDGIVFRNYPLSYWFEYVRTLGRKDCPVIVVQARCDRPEQEVRRLPADDAFLEFTSLKPCWYSAKTDRGRGALADALGDAIQFLRDRDGIVTIGVGRKRVMRQLEAWRNEDQARSREERQHRTLSQEEFRNLCEHIGGVSSPESLLAYLHNLGAVFYRPNLFQDRIILDQSWALEAVYGVFDRHKAYPLILSQGGRFTPSLLAMTAWREYAESEQRLFLSLMESCGIAFKLRDADRRFGLEDEYVAPDLISGKDTIAAQLAGRWNDQETSWRLEYEYPFLHPGLIRALLCHIGRRSRDAGVYWKYGVWVYEESTGCRAMLEQQMADDRRGRITLTVQGRRHEALVVWLRERIEHCNRLFGYPDLKPAVDEFGPSQRPRQQVEHTHMRLHGGADVTRAAAAEPTFEKPPASFFPPREPQIFVSYAWDDETPERRQRAAMVDNLCAALGRGGVNVRRDRDEMRPGDVISEFMDRLAEGDFVIAIISDKYLRSEYCMYELFRIYRNCADKPDRFLRKVIPLILPDAKLATPADRLRRAIYWTDQEAELLPLVQRHVLAVGSEFFRKFKLVGEFARNTSNMLEYLTDKLQPRDCERQAAEGFQEVLSQVTPRD